MRTRMLIALLVPCHLAFAGACRASDDVIDNVMDRVPAVPQPKVVKVFSPKLIDLWTAALDRPDADTKSRAALTIAQAHDRGMSGLGATVGPLLRELDRPGQQPTTLAAVARALVALDAKESADRLARLAAAGDYDLREIVDPALAKWDHAPARAAWLAAIGQPPPHGRGTVRAIQCLAVVKEEKAAARLRELALAADGPPQVRLEAARALGAIRTSGAEPDAAKLGADASPRALTDRLVAVHLLRHHGGGEAVRLLQAAVRDPEPAIAAIALARLVELDSSLAVPLLDTVLGSPDANVRGLGVEVLFRRPTDTHLRRLGDRLDDAHPGVRTKARKAFVELAAKPDLRDVVIREGTRLLAGNEWRGQEQSAVLLAQIGHKPATARLLALLPSARAEVGVAAAWALRTLAVPDTLPAVFEFVKDQHDRMVRFGPTAGRDAASGLALDLQLAQLIQFFGTARYAPADALLRKFLPPKGPHNTESRSAAAWALGWIHEGKPVPALATVLAGRVAAVNPFDLEVGPYRRACAVALGCMKAAQAVPTLRQFYVDKPSVDEVNNACGWALAQITGERFPPPGDVEINQLGWFLYSLD